jgi:hypothetical protein
MEARGDGLSRRGENVTNEAKFAEKRSSHKLKEMLQLRRILALIRDLTSGKNSRAEAGNPKALNPRSWK